LTRETQEKKIKAGVRTSSKTLVAFSTGDSGINDHSISRLYSFDRASRFFDHSSTFVAWGEWILNNLIADPICQVIMDI
jgi:hypothetical protein